MQGTGDSNQESKSPESEAHASKKRRVGERVVVSVKIEDNDKRQQRNEGPPSDCWSWRKYGQKPIKGSPYPRGYYRCSTSKGCSAKKQVERCKTNSSMLIVTYTSTHNHPGPGKSPNRSPQSNRDNKQEQDKINSPKQEQEEAESELVVPLVAGDSEGVHLGKTPNRSPPRNQDNKQEQDGINSASSPKQEQEESKSELAVPLVAGDSESHLQRPQSPVDSAPGHIIADSECNPFESNLQTPGGLHGEGPKSVPKEDDEAREFSPLLKSEENDFFDELEELPTTSFFTSLMKRSFCEDRVIVNPS